MRKALVLVGGDDSAHDLIGAGPVLQTAGLDGDVLTWWGSGFQRFVNVKRLVEQADAFVFYAIDPMFTPDQQTAFEQRVREGRGLVLVHCPPAPLVGGAVPDAHRSIHAVAGAAHGAHGQSAGRRVFRVGRAHPITEGIADFSVWDDTYDLRLDDGVEVLAWLGDEPALYTRVVGRGRVVFLALGHDQRTWGEPLFQQLLAQAVAWAARDRVRRRLPTTSSPGR